MSSGEDSSGEKQVAGPSLERSQSEDDQLQAALRLSLDQQSPEKKCRCFNFI